MNWFRWYHGTVTDPKMALIAHKSGQPLYLVLTVWAYLLEIGSQSVPRGDINSFDAESLSVTLVTVTSQIEKIINTMVEKNMIIDGKIGKWNMRQCDPTSAERQRKCRENKKSPVTPVTPVTVTPVTSRNVTPEENIKDLSIEKKNTRFIEPTISEVSAYCIERNNGVDPQSWINHYQAKGWMIGSAKMKDWKAAVRTWEKKVVQIQSAAVLYN